MDGRSPETCTECGFDARQWDVAKGAAHLRELGPWWESATAGVDPAVLNRRPAPAVWSPLEYGVHTLLVTAVLREGIERILAEDGVVLPEPPSGGDADPDEEPPVLERVDVVAGIAKEAADLADVVDRVPASAWSHRGTAGSMDVQAEAAFLHVVHDSSHHQRDVERILGGAGGR